MKLIKNAVLTFSTIALVIVALYFFKGHSHMKCILSNPSDLVKLFPTTPMAIHERIEHCKQSIFKTVDAITALESRAKNFDNTFRALDSLNLEITATTGPISALEYLSPNEELRNAAHEAVINISEFIVEYISTNKKLYLALKDYVDNVAIVDALSEEENNYLNDTMDDYKRLGLELDDEKLSQVRKLMQELNALGAEFEKNINQDNSFIEVTKNELAGVPEQVIESLEKKGDYYIVKTDYPTAFGILDHCTIQATRKKMFSLFNNRAYPKNIAILQEVITKRHKLAQLIGFKSFAELDLDTQMVETPAQAEKFIHGIIEKAKIKAKKEINNFLTAIQEEALLTSGGKIQPWDMRYIKNNYKKEKLAVDEKKVAEYFPLEHVLPALLHIYEQFFSIQFKEITMIGFWHQDVKVVQVFRDNKLIAYIILDLFPRENKYSHAAQLTLVPALNNDCPAAALVMANFPKATNGTPALLRFDDVNTFFHEFGHALHAILGRTNLVSQSGTNVKTDFVEMPSQMLENWLKDQDIMVMISKHYQTGKPLPEELRKKLAVIDEYDAGDATLRQLTFALLALRCFDDKPEKDVHTLYNDVHSVLRDYIALDNDDHFYASFGHLMGYGAKYYGYMWSKVFSCDLFEKIKKNGLLSPVTGQEYLEKVIQPGGSKDPNDLLEDFLGRKPTPDAFFKAMGFND